MRLVTRHSKILISLFAFLLGVSITPHAWSQNSVSLAYEVTYEWTTGFEATLTLVNDGPTIPQWKLEFDFPHSIESTSNAILEQHVGNHYTLKGLSNDPEIPGDGSVTIRIVSDLENRRSLEPTNCMINAQPCKITSPAKMASQSLDNPQDPNSNAYDNARSQANNQETVDETSFLNLIPNIFPNGLY